MGDIRRRETAVVPEKRGPGVEFEVMCAALAVACADYREAPTDGNLHEAVRAASRVVREFAARAAGAKDTELRDWARIMEGLG
jgi:hypothetical protein